MTSGSHSRRYWAIARLVGPDQLMNTFIALSLRTDIIAGPKPERWRWTMRIRPTASDRGADCTESIVPPGANASASSSWDVGDLHRGRARSLTPFGMIAVQWPPRTTS